MKYIVTLICLCISLTFQGQNKDEAFTKNLVEEFTSTLQTRGIHDFFTTAHYCLGSNSMFKIGDGICTSSGSYVVYYILWNEDGKDYLKKIDNCGLYHTQELPNTSLSNFYTKEYAALIDDVVKPYRSESYTGTPESRKTPQACIREFQFIKGTYLTEKKFNLFAISNDSDGKNLNYTFNQTLKLVALNKQVEETVATRTFKRQAE